MANEKKVLAEMVTAEINKLQSHQQFMYVNGNKAQCDGSF